MATQDTTVGQFGGSVTSLTGFLTEETGRISGDIYRRTIDTSPWLKLVKQATWPDEMGDTLRVLTYERSLAKKIADSSLGKTWEGVNNSNSKYNIPDATKVTPSTSENTYGIEHTAIESAPILVNDLRFSYSFREQLKAVYDNLVENVSWAWKDRYRDQYYALCAHNIIVGFDTSGGPISNGTLIEGTVAGTFLNNDASPEQAFDEDKLGVISNGVMNQTYMRMIRDGAGTNPMGRTDGRPIFTAIMGAENSEKLIHEEGTVTDYRESSKVNELLKPLGVERSHRGFYHIIDPFPKRFTYVSVSPFTTGTWTEIPPYVAATGLINPDYEVAEYEDVVIFHQEVMESLVPKPISTAGQGTKFNPNTYRGDFNFLNIPDKTDNPDGSWGYFRGVLANAARPVKSQFAYIIRAKRAHGMTKLELNDGTDITAEA